MPTSIRTYSQDKDLVNLRREKIARSATILFVKKGYDKSNIREIAKVCGMSIGTLYHYVGSKYDILSLVFDYVMSREAQFGEIVSSFNTLPPTEALQKAIEVYYRNIHEIQDMVLLGYQESKSLQREVRERTFEQEKSINSEFEKILARGCETGEFKVSDITLAANNIRVIGDTWAFNRWLLAKRYTIEEYIREQTNLILDGIRSHSR
jgi:AcrR family transcriptional regulator